MGSYIKDTPTDDMEKTLFTKKHINYGNVIQDIGNKQKKFRSCSIQIRYMVAVMGLLGLAFGYSLRVNIAVAIVAMTSNKTRTENGTRVKVLPADLDWDLKLQGYVLAASYYGYFTSQIPAGVIANRYGGKFVFCGGVFGSALLSLFSYLTASWSPYALMVIRYFEGFLEGFLYPGLSQIWTQWAPMQEKSNLVSISQTGSYIGTIFTMSVAGYIADSVFRWPAIFYFFGSMAMVWSVVWWYIISETPAESKCISEKELNYILANTTVPDKQKEKTSIPWDKILTSMPFWSLAAGNFAVDFGLFTWLSLMPTFISLLGFSIDHTGIIAALPHIIVVVTLYINGKVSDAVKSKYDVSTTIIRKISLGGGCIVQGVFMTIAGCFISPVTTITCLILALGFGGFSWSGVAVNYLDISSVYASISMGIGNSIASLSGIVCPTFIGTLVGNDNLTQWQIVFFLSATVYFFGGVMFFIWGSGEEQSWSSRSPQEEKKNLS